MDTTFALGESDKEYLLALSRKTISLYISKGALFQINIESVPPQLKQSCGVFVSIYKDRLLRGCIGEAVVHKTMCLLVQEMSVQAATNDTRFEELKFGELDNILIEINLLTPLKKIQHISEFELGRQGIYMKKSGRSGLFLPIVAQETGWNIEQFLGHCSRDKTGIGWDGWKNAELYTFETLSFGEKEKIIPKMKRI